MKRLPKISVRIYNHSTDTFGISIKAGRRWFIRGFTVTPERAEKLRKGQH